GAAQELHGAFRHAELLRHPFQHPPVGAPVLRRRIDREAQAVPVHRVGPFAPAARAHGHFEPQGRAVPAEPVHASRPPSPKSGLMTRMRSRLSTTMTTMGEKSMPPMGGASSRAGRSTGSVSR